MYKTQPSQFLVDNIELLPRGRALDLAMGNGRNAIFLAKMGFEVEGVDISREAIISVQEAALKAGVTIKSEIADLKGDYPIEEDAYDLIICFNYLQRSLIRQIKDGLRRGGMIVYETFIVDQARFGRPKNPDHLLKHNELLHMFQDFRCLRYREGVIDDRKAVASIIAEKV
ncbi:MAG: methyltransferase domain-containing protein [Halobacteriota archaeon]|nr:methyltransferase domain-containing protein [Halobacteriota archaeon]